MRVTIDPAVLAAHITEARVLPDDVLLARAAVAQNELIRRQRSLVIPTLGETRTRPESEYSRRRSIVYRAIGVVGSFVDDLDRGVGPDEPLTLEVEARQDYAVVQQSA